MRLAALPALRSLRLVGCPAATPGAAAELLAASPSLLRVEVLPTAGVQEEGEAQAQVYRRRRA